MNPSHLPPVSLLNSNVRSYREDATQALRYGEEQLAVMQRQATLSHLYPSAKSVMEQA